MPLYGQSKEEVEEATNRTHKWAKECLKYHTDKSQLLFGICQGGTFPDLRKHSAETIGKMNFDGFAIGGLAVGEPREKMEEMIDIALNILPENKPRYLMGVGTPNDLIYSVERGVDVFDCVWPTRTARHGKIMTEKGYITLKNAKYEDDLTPLDSKCKCKVCKTYTKSYLRHLLKQEEPLGMKLLSYHNVYFLQNLMKEIRTAIKEDTFEKLKKKYSGYNKSE
jgi:queuine tRNA-ribosyltransferase